MFERLDEARVRYFELERLLSAPDVAADPGRLRALSRELAGLRETVTAYARWKETQGQIERNRPLLSDPDLELRELARVELETLQVELERCEAALRLLLLPRDPNDDKDVVLEVRAGTGGDEAALFAADLFRMYTRYAERQAWRVELLSLGETDGGGIKEVIASVKGRGVYGMLKHESGVHRVQRVPVTESQGRIHTSTVTAAVLPEAEEVDVAIDEVKDLRIDVYRSSGPGGQSVNTTDSAVRITHLPTGVVVTCQDEKSQHKNKARALRILRSRLYDLELQRRSAERADLRRGQIKSGERSERIRTYNFPQNRVTDHRIGLTLHRLESVLAGELDELIDSLRMQAQADALAESSA